MRSSLYAHIRMESWIYVIFLFFLNRIEIIRRVQRIREEEKN
jgi:hypothetical protein